ncbi:MAG: lamin tail domain-containing protein, partial [Chloroflexota bacterium]
ITIAMVVIPTQQPVPTAFQPKLTDERFACAVNGEPQYGTVVDVVDGDTIKVLVNGLVYPLRYIGMNTPENTTQHEYFGPEASAANSGLTAGKQVTMYKDVSEVDRYNRLLRYVFVGNTFVNYELVQQGFAEAAQYPPDTACAGLFDQTAQQAQAAAIGLWAKPAAALSSGNSVVITAVNKQAEYVDIQNTSSASINLSGWNLMSERGHQGCVLSGLLPAGQTLRIWSMTGDGGFSCHYPSAIWNNTQSDPAVLYNPQGVEVDRK